MHELALARSIFRIADRATTGHAVSTIYLDMGVLHQVVPDTLDFAWGYMSRQSENLAGSELRINLASTAVTYEEYRAGTPIDDDLIFACTTCNSTRYRVKAGERFILTEMDVS